MEAEFSPLPRRIREIENEEPSTISEKWVTKMKKKPNASLANTCLTPELHTLSEGVKHIMETLWQIDEAAYVDKLLS